MSNAGLFRRYAKVKEQMIRASMPRIAAVDAPAAPNPTHRVWHTGSLIQKAAFTLAEVAHA